MSQTPHPFSQLRVSSPLLVTWRMVGIVFGWLTSVVPRVMRCRPNPPTSSGQSRPLPHLPVYCMLATSVCDTSRIFATVPVPQQRMVLPSLGLLCVKCLCVTKVQDLTAQKTLTCGGYLREINVQEVATSRSSLPLKPMSMGLCLWSILFYFVLFCSFSFFPLTQHVPSLSLKAIFERFLHDFQTVSATWACYTLQHRITARPRPSVMRYRTN
jgi:hypothetical protein